MVLWNTWISWIPPGDQEWCRGDSSTASAPASSPSCQTCHPQPHQCHSYRKDVQQSPSRTSKDISFTLACSSTATVPSQAAVTSDGANSSTSTIKPQGETKKLLAGSQSTVLTAYKKEKRGLILFLILRLVLPTAGSRSRAGRTDHNLRAESYLEDIFSGQILPGQQKAKLLEPFTFQALASKQEQNSNSH